MKKNKKMITMRLSEETITELKNMSVHYNVTVSDVIAVLAHVHSLSDFDTISQAHFDNMFNIAART